MCMLHAHAHAHEHEHEHDMCMCMCMCAHVHVHVVSHPALRPHTRQAMLDDEFRMQKSPDGFDADASLARCGALMLETTGNLDLPSDAVPSPRPAVRQTALSPSFLQASGPAGCPSARCANLWEVYRRMRAGDRRHVRLAPPREAAGAAGAPAAGAAGAAGAAPCGFGAPLVATALQRLGALSGAVDPASAAPRGRAVLEVPSHKLCASAPNVGDSHPCRPEAVAAL